MKNLINVDWLAVTLNSRDLSKSYELLYQNYTVIDHGRGTNNFKKWYTVSIEGTCVSFELQSEPYSLKDNGGIYDKGDMSLKLSNEMLYTTTYMNYIRDFLSRTNTDFVCTSRIDICNDFNRFDNGILPGDLIIGYYSGKYRRKGRTVKCMGFGSGAARYTSEYISFKGSQSAVAVRLYNKSLEMKEQTFKPYLQDLWSYHNLNIEKVWRLEFQIAPSGKKMLDKETGEIISFSLDQLDNMLYLTAVYVALIKSHFAFTEDTCRIRDAKRIPLVNMGAPMILENCYAPSYTVVPNHLKGYIKRIDKITELEGLSALETHHLRELLWAVTPKLRTKSPFYPDNYKRLGESLVHVSMDEKPEFKKNEL